MFFFPKFPNIKFHGNLSSENQVVLCEWTNGQTDQ